MSLAFKTVNILGVTGSIGRSAADVILANKDRFKVQTITAYKNAEKLAEMALALGAQRVVLVDESNIAQLRGLLNGHDIQVQSGVEALHNASLEPVDITLAAIVGMAGLEPLMNALSSSKAVAIANKEPLVSAGALVMAQAKKHGCTILPVDSEHNAIFQVFDFERPDNIEKIILTASGGPFRTWSLEDMARALPKQALAHPNWSMGRKISIDSATMMNKALEIIEAHYLFDVPPEKIDVLVHPQSVVHSLVEYCDGSVLAQMGASDMRTPISNVLAWPDRLQTPGQKLDFTKAGSLEFEAPDIKKFPAIQMAYDCMAAGHYACVALNAANEVAVAAFLSGEIGFLGIMDCVSHSVAMAEKRELPTINDVLSYDKHVRSEAQAYIDDNSTYKLVVTS